MFFSTRIEWEEAFMCTCEKGNAEQRIQIAKEYMKRYVKENPQVTGAILVGSVNLGISDKYADIDIIAITTPHAVSERKAEGKGYNETYVYKDVEICIDWHCLLELRSELNNWQNDASLWSLSHGKILLDEHEEIKRLLESIKPYPNEVLRKKLFLHFYWLSYYLNIIETSIRRSEYETAVFHIYSSLKEISEMLFLIEKKFIPIEKWRFHEMKKLDLGKKSLPILRKVMCVAELTSQELERKLTILKAMRQKLKPHLLDAGIEEEKIGPDWWKFEPDWSVTR